MMSYSMDFTWEETRINYEQYEGVTENSWFGVYFDVLVYWFNENIFDIHHDCWWAQVRENMNIPFYRMRSRNKISGLGRWWWDIIIPWHATSVVWISPGVAKNIP